jgi:hypothetical protein
MNIFLTADLEPHNARLPIMNIIEPCSHELIRIELFRHRTANNEPFRYRSSRARFAAPAAFGVAIGLEGGTVENAFADMATQQMNLVRNNEHNTSCGQPKC